MVEVREGRSMAAAATARAVAVAAARAREVARGGGDVRERAWWWWERAPHVENENGLERKKKGVGWAMKNGFLPFKSLRSGSRMKRKKEKKKLEKKAFWGSILSRFMEHVYATQIN